MFRFFDPDKQRSIYGSSRGIYSLELLNQIRNRSLSGCYGAERGVIVIETFITVWFTCYHSPCSLGVDELGKHKFIVIVVVSGIIYPFAIRHVLTDTELCLYNFARVSPGARGGNTVEPVYIRPLINVKRVGFSLLPLDKLTCTNHGTYFQIMFGGWHLDYQNILMPK